MRVAWLSLIALGCAAPQPPCPCATPARAPAAPTCPSSDPSSASSVVEPTPLPATCGGLALREARLVAGGKGDKHPELVAVRERLAQCADRKPTPAECSAVYAEGAQLEAQYGPKHPMRVMNAAEKALCPSPVVSPPPPPPPVLGPPTCGAGKSACGSGPHSTCCGSGETCCAGGVAGSYYCKKGKGPCPPLP